MVIYDLICESQHSFEGWFKSNEDFVIQQEQALLCCPVCDSTKVKKVPTASYVATRKNTQTETGSQHQLLLGNEQQLLEKIKSYIVANTEDVGIRFAEEARKIHYGETQKRNIRGQANVEEVKSLYDEGIEIIPVPGNLQEKKKMN